MSNSRSRAVDFSQSSLGVDSSNMHYMIANFSRDELIDGTPAQ